MDWKAITIGFVATMIIGLCIQLVYVLIASWIGLSSASVPAIAEYKEDLWLAGAMISYAITMLICGAITMMAARTRRLINPLIAGALVTVVSVTTSVNYDTEITSKSIVALFAGTLLSILGGHLVRRIASNRMPPGDSA